MRVTYMYFACTPTLQQLPEPLWMTEGYHLTNSGGKQSEYLETIGYLYAIADLD